MTPWTLTLTAPADFLSKNYLWHIFGSDKRVLTPLPCLALLGHTPSTAGTFRKKFRQNSGKTPETLSECFLEFLSRVRLGCPKPYNSRHLRLPERFQNSLPPSTAGDASFFRILSGEGLSELVMEFPAVLGVFLNCKLPTVSRIGVLVGLHSKETSD